MLEKRRYVSMNGTATTSPTRNLDHDTTTTQSVLEEATLLDQLRIDFQNLDYWTTHGFEAQLIFSLSVTGKR